MMEKIVPTIRPSYKQHLAYQVLYDQITSFLLFGGGAEGGKSWLGAEWLMTNCYFYPGTKWFIGRNELTRLMASSYATFRKVCAYHDIPTTDWKFNGQYHYIEFRNPETGIFDGEGSRIDCLDLKYTPADPMFQRFGSTEYTGGWIEEAGEVHFMAFDVLKSRVGRWKNIEYNLFPKILLTCNPEQNWLYRIFYKPWRKKQLQPGYAFIQALYKDNPYTAAQAEKRLDRITDPILRMRLKMGLWEYNVGDNSLVTYDALLDMFTNSIDFVGEKYFTGDVARYGSDKIVLASWQGLDLYQLEAKQHRGIDLTSTDVRVILRNDQIPYSHAIVDDDGVGGGVVDNVRGIRGFVGNSSALKRRVIGNSGEEEDIKENYGNLRSQCAFMIAEYINHHKIRISAKIDEPTKEFIIEDLQQMLRKVDTPIESPLRIISKDDIKMALGRSPDFADVLMMRMFFELDSSQEIQHLPVPTSIGGALPYFPGIG